MQTYSYHALNPEGAVEHGVIQAENRRGAEVALTHLCVIQLRRRWVFHRSRRASPDARTLVALQVLFTRLAVLINAGIALPDALQMIRHSTQGRHHDYSEYLVTGIESGRSLSSLTADRSADFGRLIPALLSIAETTGTLGKSLEHISVELSRQIKTIRLIRQVSVYPLFVTIILLSAIVFLLVYIVPSLQEFLESSGQALPFHTQVLIGLSERVAQSWTTVVMLALTFILLMRLAYRLSVHCQQLVDRGVLLIPIIGDLTLTLSLARLCHSLSVLLAGGVDIVESLTQCSRSINSLALKKILSDITREVESGLTLSAAFQQQPVIPVLVPQLVSNGEASGKLSDMFAYLGHHYQEESERRLAYCVSLIGPALMCLVGVMMLWVIISVLGPVYESVFQAGAF